VKLTEDIKIQYDGTVRDIAGNIYQLSYGEDGINPISTIKVGGEQEICDVDSIINKLNMKYETRRKVKSK
jgi:DNA-directed RNA polymerase beta' subunit